MLMSTQINRYAHQLLDVRAKTRTLAPLTTTQTLSHEDAYGIAYRIFEARIASGATPVGRKIGFVNRTVWPHREDTPTIHTPIWAPIFRDTLVFAEDNFATVHLKTLVQARLEAEIVFSLGATPPPNASMQDLADCIAWMAHGIEISSCPYPDWKFETADAIAAFGLHGALIVGEARTLSGLSRSNLDAMMKDVTVSVSCDGVLQTAGFGSDILNSPLHALWHLHQMLQNQTHFPPLVAGEIVTTGSWTEGLPVAPGQVWQTAYSGIALSGLALQLKK